MSQLQVKALGDTEAFWLVFTLLPSQETMSHGNLRREIHGIILNPTHSLEPSAAEHSRGKTNPSQPTAQVRNNYCNK